MKMAESFLNGSKTLETGEIAHNDSPVPTVFFNRYVLRTRKIQDLFGKGLTKQSLVFYILGKTLVFGYLTVRKISKTEFDSIHLKVKFLKAMIFSYWCFCILM